MQSPSAQIVPFPIAAREPAECDNFYDAVYQLKRQAAQMLNEIALGAYPMSPENADLLTLINRLCQDAGLTPLEY